jgi:hypothetical protein
LKQLRLYELDRLDPHYSSQKANWRLHFRLKEEEEEQEETSMSSEERLTPSGYYCFAAACAFLVSSCAEELTTISSGGALQQVLQLMSRSSRSTISSSYFFFFFSMNVEDFLLACGSSCRGQLQLSSMEQQHAGMTTLHQQLLALALLRRTKSL